VSRSSITVRVVALALALVVVGALVVACSTQPAEAPEVGQATTGQQAGAAQEQQEAPEVVEQQGQEVEAAQQEQSAEQAGEQQEQAADQGGQGQEASEAGGEAEGETAGEAAFVPLDADACSELADSVSEALGVDAVSEEVEFEDYIAGGTGSGCQTSATGTGLDFESFSYVADQLRTLLTAEGWTEDMTYLADGPTGTATAFKSDGGLCLLSVNWEPSEDADCPPDQPISACQLEPEQKIYTVLLNCAQLAPDQ